MEQQTEMKKERKKILIIGGICLLLIVVIAGYTYSYFVVRDTDTTTITGTVASGNLTVEINQLSPSETYQNEGLIPQKDGAIENAIKGTTIDNALQGCVDGNGNAICQVFEISVTNDSNTDVTLDGFLQLNAQNNPNLKWAKLNGYTAGVKPADIADTAINPYSYKLLASKEEYTKNETKKYYVAVWISETGEEQKDTGKFTGTVTFGVGLSGELDDSLAANTLKMLGAEYDYQVNIPNFANTSCSQGCDEATVGIYKTVDNDGTSYYYRGDVTNNYVKFGKYSTNYVYAYDEYDPGDKFFTSMEECQNVSTRHCELIAEANDDMYWRIIRINGDGSVRMIYDGTSPYTNGTSGIKYTGYAASSMSYDMRNNIWYPTFLENTIYDEYIVSANYNVNNEPYETTGEEYNQIIKTKTYERLIVNKSPSLLTSNTTKKRYDTITPDELAFAGIVNGKSNTKNYLYDVNTYRTNTISINKWVFDYYFNSNLSPDSSTSEMPSRIRPVISIDPSILTYGNGTAGNPYRMEP